MFTIQEKLIVAAIALVLALLVAQPHFEARAFNKFSAKKATYWDAAFAELRVAAER